MKILSWNARGLGSARAFNCLRSQKNTVNPDILFLMETKDSNARMEVLRVKLGFVGKLVVDCCGKSGGLYLFWAASIQVDLLSLSVAHIDVRVVTASNR